MKILMLVAASLSLFGASSLWSPAALADDRRSSLSGTVYFDANANGRPDPQERAVKNLQVNLDGPDYHESRITGENGSYEFSGLGAGSYTLSVKLPRGYGLSQGANAELVIDGRTTITRFDLGVARADQLPPTPVPTAAAVPPTPTPWPRTTLPAPPIAPAAPPVSSDSAPGPSGGPRVGVAPPLRQVAPPPAAPRQPEPTATPLPTSTPAPTAPPTSTPEPTPTRTPPPIDDQQAAAERARAALASPSPPHSASAAAGDNLLLDVPFRTALDGSDYADTNSGVAAVGMALEAYGFGAPTADLRALANVLGRSYDVGQPPRLEVLSRLAEQAGLRGLGLYQGVRLALWSVDDVKAQLRAGKPVLTQVRFDDVTGDGEQAREHYILLIGLNDGDIVYHDPTYPDERGARRTLPAASLTGLWASSPGSGQAVAFALGPDELGLLAPVEQLRAAQQPSDKPAAAAPTPISEAQETASAAAPLKTVDAADLAAIGDAAAQQVVEAPGGLPMHPLLLAFWATAAIILIRVVAGLVLG